jgi:hypothetical protein
MGAWTALIALVLQFALSVGHIHADEIYRHGGMGGSEGILIAALASLADEAQPRAADDEDGPNHDKCPICLDMAMLGTGAVPAPPALALPHETGTAPALPSPATLTLARSPHLLFSTRAPPGIG